jgi:hypothetical protein
MELIDELQIPKDQNIGGGHSGYWIVRLCQL